MLDKDDITVIVIQEIKQLSMKIHSNAKPVLLKTVAILRNVQYVSLSTNGLGSAHIG